MTTLSPPCPAPLWPPADQPWRRRTTIIALLSLSAIGLHVLLRYGLHASVASSQIPLLVTLTFGGMPLLDDGLRRLGHRQAGADLLGGIALLVSILCAAYLVGAVIVVLFAGGAAREPRGLRPAPSGSSL